VTNTFTTVNGLSINSNEHFTVTYNAGSVVLTVVSGPVAPSMVSASAAVRPGLLPILHHGSMVKGHYGPEVATRRIAQIPVMSNALGVHGFHRMDEVPGQLASADPSATPGVGVPVSTLGLSSVSASAYNGMGTMNHMRFECGIDLKALLKTSRKQLLKGLVAAPDSPNALSIGYMVYNGR